jgi:hypothetical protein
MNMTLQDTLDAPRAATAWRPEPGESIIGELADVGERDGGYGPYPVLTLATDDGARTVHAFHEVLRNELAKLAPQIGERIGIKYVGKHPERGYHQYRLRAERAGGSVNWSRYSEANPEEQPERHLTSVPEPAPAEAAAASGGDDIDDIPY